LAGAAGTAEQGPEPAVDVAAEAPFAENEGRLPQPIGDSVESLLRLRRQHQFVRVGVDGDPPDAERGTLMPLDHQAARAAATTTDACGRLPASHPAQLVAAPIAKPVSQTARLRPPPRENSKGF